MNMSPFPGTSIPNDSLTPLIPSIVVQIRASVIHV
jgi:hypothetical protein